jgi:hypothetical protein
LEDELDAGTDDKDLWRHSYEAPHLFFEGASFCEETRIDP